VCSISCPGFSYEKRIERVTLTKSGGGEAKKPVSAAEKMREKIVRRAACEFKHGMYANLGRRNSKRTDVLFDFTFLTAVFTTISVSRVCGFALFLNAGSGSKIQQIYWFKLEPWRALRIPYWYRDCLIAVEGV
jgi:hypothetical protein